VTNVPGWINTGGTTLVGSATIATSGTFTLAAHGLANGTVVEFKTIASGAVGVLVAGAEYYVRNQTTNTFQVSATPGGTIMVFASTGTADVYTAVPAYSALDLRRLDAFNLHPASADRLGARQGVRPHSTDPISVAGTNYSIPAGTAVVYPRETSTSGAYRVYYDGVSAALNPADGTNPRIDGFDLQVQDEDEDGGTQRRAQVVYVPGTPAGSPSAPLVTDNSWRLGTILVPAGGSPAPSVATRSQFADGPGILPVRTTAERPSEGLFEGMMVWRQDTDTLEVWDGAAWQSLASFTSFNAMRRIARTIRDTNSSSFTAETVINSVTASLVAGKTYAIKWKTNGSSTVAGDRARFRIRETNVSGTQRDLANLTCDAATVDYPVTLYDEYTAVSTGSKTFVGTCQLQAGAGNISVNANANQRHFLTVDYIQD